MIHWYYITLILHNNDIILHVKYVHGRVHDIILFNYIYIIYLFIFIYL